MNPLRPSPRLLRRIAGILGTSQDRYIGPWLEQMKKLPAINAPRKFDHTSVVETFRGPRRKLCGYEVWRHLERGDPKRKKARLWFGCRRFGGPLKTRQKAYYAAATIARMTPAELREWWSEYQAARTARRPVSSLWREENNARSHIEREDDLCIAGIPVYSLQRAS